MPLFPFFLLCTKHNSAMPLFPYCFSVLNKTEKCHFSLIFLQWYVHLLSYLYRGGLLAALVDHPCTFGHVPLFPYFSSVVCTSTFLPVQGWSPRCARQPPLYLRACATFPFFLCVVELIFLCCIAEQASLTHVAKLGKTYSVVSLRSTTIKLAL